MSSLEQQGVHVGILQPADATPELAEGVAAVAVDAYAARLPHIPRDTIAQWQEADTDTTLGYLRRGPEQGWYWALATKENVGRTAVHGVSLSIVRNGEVFVAELHTHPEAQRQGIARATAACAIRAAAGDPSLAGMDNVQTMLNVIRQRPNDPTEHPAAWYRSIGYSKVGDSDPIGPDGWKMPAEQMRAPVYVVLGSLETKRA